MEVGDGSLSYLLRYAIVLNQRTYVFNQVVFFVGLAFRAIVTVFYSDMELNTSPVQVLNFTVCPELHLKALTLNVVVIGVLMVIIYGLSIMSSLHLLIRIQGLPGQARRNILCAREMWTNWRVVVATCISVFDAIWFFWFVREIWVAPLDVVIQVLQVIPSLVVIIDTILSGFLVCAESALNDVQLAQHAGYQRDISPHQGAHFLMVMYAVFNVLVARSCTREEVSIIVEFVPLFAVLDLLARNYIVFELGRRARVARVENHLAQAGPQVASEQSNNVNSALVRIQSEPYFGGDGCELAVTNGTLCIFTYFKKNDKMVPNDKLVINRLVKSRSSLDWFTPPTAPDAEHVFVRGN